MGIPPDFPWESQQDGMAGQRPATPPMGLVCGPPLHPSNPPTGKPKKTHTLPPLVNKKVTFSINPLNNLQNDPQNND